MPSEATVVQSWFHLSARGYFSGALKSWDNSVNTMSLEYRDASRHGQCLHLLQTDNSCLLTGKKDGRVNNPWPTESETSHNYHTG